VCGYHYPAKSVTDIDNAAFGAMNTPKEGVCGPTTLFVQQFGLTLKSTQIPFGLLVI